MSLRNIHTPLSNLDAPELVNFHRNGFHFFERESYSWCPEFFEKIKEFRNNDSNFELKSKNNGGRTLKNEVMESRKASFIVDYLFETNLLQRCMEVVGTPLYLTNYIFIECHGKTKSLPWHRDTYHYKNSNRVGLIPYNYKLLISNDHLDNNSSGTEVLKGSHNIDFSSSLFDFFYKILKPGKTRFSGRIGDAIIFNGHAMHRRPETKSNKSRSTIIFGLAPVQWHQTSYVKNHSNVIERYNQNFEKLISANNQNA